MMCEKNNKFDGGSIFVGVCVMLIIVILVFVFVLPAIFQNVYVYEEDGIKVIRISKFGFDSLRVLPNDPEITKSKTLPCFLQDEFGSDQSAAKVAEEVRIKGIAGWYDFPEKDPPAKN